MDKWKSKVNEIIDSHVHMGSITDEKSMLKILEATGMSNELDSKDSNPVSKGSSKIPICFPVFTLISVCPRFIIFDARKIAKNKIKAPAIMAKSHVNENSNPLAIFNYCNKSISVAVFFYS